MNKSQENKAIQAIKQKLISTVEEIAQALFPDSSPVPVPVTIKKEDHRPRER